MVPALRNCLAALRDKLAYLEVCARNNGDAREADAVGTTIRSISALKELYLDSMIPGCFIALMGQVAFDGGPPNLRHLSLRFTNLDWNNDPTGVGEAVRNMLTAATNLTEFTLRFCTVYEIQPTGTETLFAHVRNHPSIRKVSVSQDGPASFHVLLGNNNVLQNLTVTTCVMENVLEILESLQMNTVLKRLTFWIAGSYLDVKSFMDAHAARIGRFVSQLTSLQVLKLGYAHQDRLGTNVRGFKVDDIPVEFVQGFADNTSLTQVFIAWIPNNSEIGKALQFYATRNEYRPLLLDQLRCPKPMMVETFETLLQSREDATCCALSVIFEALKVRDDWYD